jgi:hypothetical protein
MQLQSIYIGILSVSLLIAVLYKLVKAPLPPTSMKWRSMTVSSIFNFPGITLLIIIGFAVLVTALFSGHFIDTR